MPALHHSDGLDILSVDLQDRSYDVVVGVGLLDRAGEFLANWLQRKGQGGRQPSAFLMTDANVTQHAQRVRLSLEAGGWRVRELVIPAGENSKRLEIISQGWDELVQFQADRRTVVLAVGGGVVGDAAGFVAASFARGVPFVQIPTTLLADVDSSVGGKVGINHPQAKNLIGAFHQPLGVLIDLAALETLPDREYRSGLAEVVKYGVILDEPFFQYLEQNAAAIGKREAGPLRTAIARSCELKALVVEQDEYERTGLRAVLNYGHTFAHALEALTGYGTLLHGEAVSIGMVQAARLAERLGRVPAEFSARQLALLQQLHIPTELPAGESVTANDMLQRMRLDKKTVGGQLRFVLPTRMGHVELVDGVPEAEVRATLAEFGIH